MNVVATQSVAPTGRKKRRSLVTDGYERRRLRKAVERQRAAIVEETTTSTPAEWLRMRVWVAWRIVLAQGKGRSGRRICHGAGRHHLRELLYEAALGIWREFPAAPTSLMDLRST
jgi:hypothetical protein